MLPRISRHVVTTAIDSGARSSVRDAAVAGSEGGHGLGVAGGRAHEVVRALVPVWIAGVGHHATNRSVDVNFGSPQCDEFAVGVSTYQDRALAQLT